MSSGEKIFWLIIIVTIVMVNPPLLIGINNYCKAHLLTLGVPTFWLWLEIWYLIGSSAFLIGAWKLRSWKGEEIEDRIKRVKIG